MTTNSDKPPSTQPEASEPTTTNQAPARTDVIEDLSSASTKASEAATHKALDDLRESLKTAGVDPRIVQIIKIIHTTRKDIDAIRPILDQLEKFLPPGEQLLVDMAVQSIDDADDALKKYMGF